MKAVIIGGGIAGLTIGVLLQKRNWDVVINEKSSGILSQGHAFLMSEDGYSILAEFFNSTKTSLNNKQVNLFSLKRPNGEEVIKIKLDGWRCLKRIDLITFLYSLFDENSLKKGRAFSHFLFKDDKAIAAVFENGDIEYGDIFIGADGSNSKVREVVYGKVNFTPVEVKEVVSVSSKKINSKNDVAIFQKVQSEEIGIAFGHIPTSSDQVVWFMQYDVNLSDGSEEKSPESLKSFCLNMTKNFPPEVKEILEANDFSDTYIWNTRDFDLLPTFHKNNIVIMGDAAHLAVPFTSAGTTNAILDAKTLSESLEKFDDYHQAFDNYYNLRSQNLKSHVEQGRELKKLFLNPKFYSERGFILPLVSDKDKNTSSNATKPLKILYFTDPICSTCWVIQPILRKLKLDYDKYIEIEYHMGGLLPSWENYNKGNIKNPSDAAKHWEEVSDSQKTPLDGDIWIEDPLNSSYPPSIAFKAAQLQNNDKAIFFLRRIKEMVFIEKKNITRWNYIEEAALTSGLDSALLLKDIRGNAKRLFEDDLKLAKSYDVTSFPTLLFSNGINPQIKLKGLHPYEKLEEIIHQLLPDIKKSKNNIEPKNLFTLFNSMSEQEFAFLNNFSVETGKEILHQLHQEEKIDKYESKNGIIWRYNN